MARITYLEDTLYADVDGTVRDAFVRKLVLAEAGLSARLRRPVTATEFLAIERALAAVLATREVIERVSGRSIERALAAVLATREVIERVSGRYHGTDKPSRDGCSKQLVNDTW